LPDVRGFGVRKASTWAALLHGATFLTLGIGFAAAPQVGASVFGIGADGMALAYVRAIGFRDIALALYIFGLIVLGARGALSIVLAGSLVIPACDVALVLSVSGWSSAGQVFLHLAGAVALAGTSFWLRAEGALRPADTADVLRHG
jgi:hypothetical protein